MRRIDTHANIVGSDAVRISDISRVDWTTAVTGCPPAPKEFFGRRVAHDCVKQGLTQSICGDDRCAYCAYTLDPIGIESSVYCIVHKLSLIHI